MGIDGLLRQLKGGVEAAHLRQFAGQTVVVDAFSWLHKACYGCAFELSTGRATDSYVRYMLRKVDLVRSCGVKQVILVFDGQRLPLKASTHEKRQRYKEENRKLALESMQAARRLDGDDRQNEMNKVYSYFQKSVSISPQVIENVMNAFREAKIPFVVAPFEADPQMVWLCKEEGASAIITEDSDVLVYCMTANVDVPVLVKLDDAGSVQAVSRSILHRNSRNSKDAFMKKIHFLTSGDKNATRMFVQACVLAGCDFLDSLPNTGIVTAVKHIFNFRGAPDPLRVQRILFKLSSGGTVIPPDYKEGFAQAECLFYHHIIFDAKQQTCQFLVDQHHANSFPDVYKLACASLGIDEDAHRVNLHASGSVSKSSFLGSIPSVSLVQELYAGRLCPRSLRELSVANSDSSHSRNVDTPAIHSSYSQDLSSNQDASSRGSAFVTTVARREVRAIPAGSSPPIRSKHHAESSMKSLLQTYSSSVTHSGSNQNVVSHDVGTIKSPVKQVVESTVVKPTSMQALFKRHSRDTRANETSAPLKKIKTTPGNASNSVVIQRNQDSSRPKLVAVAGKKQGNGGAGGTLLSFFKKI